MAEAQVVDRGWAGETPPANRTKDGIAIARYRQKDEVDLRWNQLRRRLTRELDTQLQDWREQALNHILSEAWTEYTKQLESGEVRVLEPVYSRFVKDALDDVIDVKVPSA